MFLPGLFPSPHQTLVGSSATRVGLLVKNQQLCCCLDMEQSAIQPAALLKWQILREQTEKANSVASQSLQTCFGQAAHPSTSKKFNRKILETRESKREQISLPHILGSTGGRLIKGKNAEAPKLSTHPCLSGRLCTCKAKGT